MKLPALRSLGPCAGRPSIVRFLRRPAAAIALVMALLLVQGTMRLDAQDPPPVQKIVVQPGDTLSSIALRIYGSPAAVERIAAANNLANPDLIVAGTLLLVPTGGGAPATATTSAPARQTTVEPGDTLSAISLRVYGTPAYAPAIAEANGISDPDRVLAGTKLTLPAAPLATAAGTRAAGGPLAGRRICLDPGHGGAAEPGTVFDFGDGKLLREADVALDLARTLRTWLEADGATVTMTRNSDTFLGLDERAAICNMAGADIAVSLHLNGGDNPLWNGSLALFAKTPDRKLAELIGSSLHLGLARTAPAQPFFAYGARPFDGAVLLHTFMPAVIVEPVFLTNPAEARALLATTADAGSRRNQIVLEVYRGIRMYFAQ